MSTKVKVKKKERISPINVLLFALLTVMIAALVFWAGKVSAQLDRKEIKPKNFSELDAPAVSEAPEPAENVDIKALTKNFSYVSIESSALSNGPLCLLDGDRVYAGDTELAGIYESLFDDDGLQIASARSADIEGQPEMLSALREMLCAFYKDTGLRTVMIERGYSPAEQKSEDTQYEEGYYDEYGNYIQPEPAETEQDDLGCYEHESGYAVDLGLYLRETGGFGEFTGEGDYAWFAENAHTYGFILRYPEGKEDITGAEYNAAHFRYVGKAAAAVMHERGICLEEFLDLIKDFGYDDPLAVQTDSGFQAIYYIGDSGLETTDVQIPADEDGETCPYTVSGNNVDGYIITAAPTEDFAERTGAASAESAVSSDASEQNDE